MGQTNDIRPLGFVTKHRHRVFTDAHLSRLVNSLKGVSSRPLPQELPELARHPSGPEGCGPLLTSPAAPTPPPQSTSNLKTEPPSGRPEAGPGRRVARSDQATSGPT